MRHSQARYSRRQVARRQAAVAAGNRSRSASCYSCGGVTHPVASTRTKLPLHGHLHRQDG
jgi:hypothetical protein